MGVTSAFCLWSREQQVTIIKLLIANGVSVNTHDDVGLTPLMALTTYGNSRAAPVEPPIKQGDAVVQAPGKNPEPHRAFIFTIYSHPRILSQRHIGRRDLPAPCQGTTKRNAARRPNYKGENAMVKLAFYARLEAKPGKEKEVEQFLQSAVPLVEEEQGTITWYALRMGPSTFGIFDTFNDEAGRQAHLSGKVAAALMAKAPDLFAKAPEISKVDVLASKVTDAKRKASA